MLGDGDVASMSGKKREQAHKRHRALRVGLKPVIDRGDCTITTSCKPNRMPVRDSTCANVNEAQVCKGRRARGVRGNGGEWDARGVQIYEQSEWKQTPERSKDGVRSYVVSVNNLEVENVK